MTTDNKVEALISDHLGNLKKWSQIGLGWLLIRMSSRKQLHGKKIEGSRLREIHKLIGNS